jgi:hypothetical protein
MVRRVRENIAKKLINGIDHEDGQVGWENELNSRSGNGEGRTSKKR